MASLPVSSFAAVNLPIHGRPAWTGSVSNNVPSVVCGVHPPTMKRVMRRIPVLLLACLVALGMVPWRVEARPCCRDRQPGMTQRAEAPCAHCAATTAKATSSCCAASTRLSFTPACTCAKPLRISLLPASTQQPELTPVLASGLMDFLHDCGGAVVLAGNCARPARMQMISLHGGPPGTDPSWLALHHLLI